MRILHRGPQISQPAGQSEPPAPQSARGANRALPDGAD
jgi:hypothetical protein